MASSKVSALWISIITRGALFLLIWWIITDGTVSSLWIGIPAVLLAVTISCAQAPSTPFVWSELLRFVPFFLLNSFLGGVDVARRVFHPTVSIAPDLIEYPLQLPTGLPRVIMVNTVGLLPGTLSAELTANSLNVHVLDGRKAFLSDLQKVEQYIARMFGSTLNVSKVNE